MTVFQDQLVTQVQMVSQDPLVPRGHAPSQLVHRAAQGSLVLKDPEERREIQGGKPSDRRGFLEVLAFLVLPGLQAHLDFQFLFHSFLEECLGLVVHQVSEDLLVFPETAVLKGILGIVSVLVEGPLVR